MTEREDALEHQEQLVVQHSQASRVWGGDARWHLVSTLERGAGAVMGDAWDEQFQQCCHVLPFEMGQSLLLLLVSTQEGLRLRQSSS